MRQSRRFTHSVQSLFETVIPRARRGGAGDLLFLCTETAQPHAATNILRRQTLSLQSEVSQCLESERSLQPQNR